VRAVSMTTRPWLSARLIPATSRLAFKLPEWASISVSH
jgi:hypothetical protein